MGEARSLKDALQHTTRWAIALAPDYAMITMIVSLSLPYQVNGRKRSYQYLNRTRDKSGG